MRLTSFHLDIETEYFTHGHNQANEYDFRHVEEAMRALPSRLEELTVRVDNSEDRVDGADIAPKFGTLAEALQEKYKHHSCTLVVQQPQFYGIRFERKA